MGEVSGNKKNKIIKDSDFYWLDFEHLKQSVGQDVEMEVAKCVQGAQCNFHVLPELPYAYDAFEPLIDAKTMEVHYDQHHRIYVKKLNKILMEYPELQKRSLEELLRGIDSIPLEAKDKLRTAAGGHYNHSMLWTILSPLTHKTVRSAAFNQKLELDFGDFAKFQECFFRSANTLLGRGYVWLYHGEESKLHLKALPNQDNPLVKGFIPILLMDLWQHAYETKYLNRRDKYVEAFWSLINWEEVSRRWELCSGASSRAV